MKPTINKIKQPKMIIKKCHICGQITESASEVEKCLNCGKNFLPLNYFEKVHTQSGEEYRKLFAESHEIHEEDIIQGIYVLW